MALTIEQRLADLRRQIAEHDRLYYVLARPVISDQDYDALLRELIDLERQHPDLITPDSPTQRIGDQPTEGFAQLTHELPMLSIDNTYNEAELRAFDERVRKALGDQPPTYVVEEKVDGVAVSLRYERGRLISAATRGDGRTGDNITANARTIATIPLRLADGAPELLEVRGEVYMLSADFQALNRRREQAGEETYKNPRNLAAGTLKLLDPREVAKRPLRFLAHGRGAVRPLPVGDYWSWLDLLRKLGLPTAPHAEQAADIDAVIAAIGRFQAIRGTLAYQTDGMVVKVNDFAQRDMLGATSKSPRWVIAYKYPAEQAHTTLNAVTWQVGKGGTLTPVAELEPVYLAGTTVKRATLHNLDQINRLDVRVGDTVVVEKAGEIIPQVVQVLPERRPADAAPIVAPAACPSCLSPVARDGDTPYIRCTNPDCPEVLKGRLRHFAARNQMDIENLGEAIIDQLVDARLVRTFGDLYRQSPLALANLERMGAKSVDNLLASIESSRQRKLDRLLAGLGIRHVGTRVAYLLASRFTTLAALEQASVEGLSAVDEIGPAIAQSVYDYFHGSQGQAEIAALRAAGVDPTMPEAPPTPAGLPLAGKSIVVTGTLERFSRSDIEQWIVTLGGKSAGTVSRKTAFVVAGADAGSKLAKARDLGVEVIDEATFISRYGTPT